jgi:divalent metal cation (Fe/Co/Zn/Cd) transporter
VDSVGRRAKESRKLLLAGVFVNLVLALTKIAGGLFGRSHALIADGIESSLDVLSSVMMWGAIKYAERPPDSDHPYGHGKMESLAAVAGSLLLIMAGAALGLHSIREIFLLQRSTWIILQQVSRWPFLGRPSFSRRGSSDGSICAAWPLKARPFRLMRGTIAPTR